MLRSRKSQGSSLELGKGKEEEICISFKLKEIGKGKRNDQRKIRSWDSKKWKKGERGGGWEAPN